MGRTRKSQDTAPDNGPQITEKLSTNATRITSKGVSTDKPAPTSAENPNTSSA